MRQGLLAVAFTAWSIVGCAPASPEPPDGRQAFVGARVFDGTGAEVMEDATLVVRDGRIEAVGAADEVEVPPGAERIDLTGKTVIPGLINTHGHVNDVQGLEGGHYTRENLLRQLRLYARFGVTAVNSLGGDGPEAVALRDGEGATLDRARLTVAGAVVTGPTIADVQSQVDANVALGADFIKIRVDDNLGQSTKMSPELYVAAIDRAHDKGLKLASHLFYLEDARGLLKAGADFVAHSVRDQPVDEEVLELMKQRGVCYCPTLTRELSTFAYEGVPDWFEDPFFLQGVDPSILDELQEPERMERIKESPAAQAYKKALEVARGNLKRVVDAGVTVGFGTDSGPPARFQGYFEHLELEMMVESGLTPRQALLSATGDAAACLGFSSIGTLEVGRWADFVVLGENPLEDIRRTRTIDAVYIAGNLVPDDL